jgi:TonB family protein
MSDFFYHIDNKSIRKALVNSFLIHAAILALIYTGSMLTPKPKFLMGDVYTVNLTEMPLMSGPVTASPSTAPLSLAEAPATNGKTESNELPKATKVIPKALETPKKDSFPLKIKPIQANQPKPQIRSLLGQGNDTEMPKASYAKPGPEIRKFSGGQMLGAVKGNNRSSIFSGMNGNSLGSSIGGMQGKPFPDPLYLQRIQERITQNWNPPEGVIGRNKQLNLLVFFTINRQGKISNIMIEEPSGSTVLDQSAIRAVQLSDPLLPIPPLIKDEILKVHFRFTYNG